MIEGIFLALAAFGQSAPAPVTDPLAPARTGQMQCVSPNIANKTCFAIARFIPNADGGFTNDVTVLISPQMGLTMETVSAAHVENGQVCGTVILKDMMASKLSVNGTAMTEEQAGPIKAQILAAVTPMDGKKACSTYKAEGDMLSSETSLDGVAHPEMNQKLIWVKPEDGFKLGQ